MYAEAGVDLGALKLFNDKAQLLRESRFVELVKAGTGWTITSVVNQPVNAERVGPDDAAIREFVVTLRFFIQDNERCSIRNVAKIYERLRVSDEKKKKISECQALLNTFLDSPSSLQIGTGTITHGRIMRVFVYGGIAHANTEKTQVLDSWKKPPEFYIIIYDIFVDVISRVLVAVDRISEVNAEVLLELRHHLAEAKHPTATAITER